MPYIILVIGILIGLFALYQFMVKANVAQIRALYLAAGALGIAVALFYLSVTGRFAAALGIIVAALPICASLYRSHRKQSMQNEAQSDTASPSPNTTMTRAQALEILGLDEPTTEEDIKTAYKRLMKKLHPDQDGSEWIASKLNEAKDFLLKETHKQ